MTVPFGYGPHWDIGGDDAADRLGRAVEARCALNGEPVPSALQISAVLHALADHTSIQQALVEFRPDSDTPWPEATAIGRWLHAYGDYMESIP